MSYRLDLRKSVANLFGRLSTSEILTVFKDKPISRRTIFRVLKDCREQQNKPKCGRKVSLDKATTTKLLLSAKDKVGVSQRRLARKYHVSQPTIHRILKKNNLILRKRKRTPKYTEKQLEKIPKCCRALRRKHFTSDTFIVLDDEKYFTFAQHELSGNDHFYTDDIQSTPDNVKFKGKEKFEPKVLMWIVISSKGCSEPYIRPVGAPAVNSDV